MMSRFYKVNVYEKAYGNKDFPLASNFEDKCIGQVIVKKGLFFAREIITNFELEVSESSYNLVYGFNLNRYGRDLYIKKSDICYNNIVDALKVEQYIDEFNYDDFCLNNELEIDRKSSKRENKEIVKVINNYNKNKRF